MTVTLSPSEAASFLVGHLGLRQPAPLQGLAGIRSILKQLRCLQLDPLDRVGTNQDLVVLARVDGVRRGDVFAALLPGHAFEHFAKERCLLPASAFPWYRDESVQPDWWRLSERYQKIPASLVDAVLDEVRRRGPLSAKQLGDHGSVEPMDWAGWKGTARAATMALEILWTRCRVVVCGRGRRATDGKLWDVPERALPEHAATPRAGADFARWAIAERAEAAGLLSSAAGPWWSMLSTARKERVPEAMLAEGLLEEVRVDGSPRRWLAPRGFRARVAGHPPGDGRMRILGPLDPLLWDRTLLKLAFGFDYVWEVYKPAPQRKWGWYVVPLLHGDELVGRMEAKVEGSTLVVERLWREEGRDFDEDAFNAALERHAQACGADRVKRKRGAR